MRLRRGDRFAQLATQPLDLIVRGLLLLLLLLRRQVRGDSRPLRVAPAHAVAAAAALTGDGALLPRRRRRTITVVAAAMTASVGRL